jgi:hypothetical protein
MSDPQSPFDAWSAAEPAPGFADRVAHAVARDQTARRRSAVVRVRIALAAAACMLVSIGAYAWSSSPFHVAASPLPGLAPIERADPVPSALAMGAVSDTSMPAASTVVRAPRMTTPPRATDAGAPPAARVPKVPLPSCVCNAFACDCGPE